MRGLHKKYLQVGDTGFPDSARDGFHRRAHRVQKRCQLACAFSFSALFKQKSRQSHNISVERSPVWHGCRFKDVLADLKKERKKYRCCINNMYSCNSFNRGNKNMKAEMVLERGVWRAKPMRSAQSEAQRCDWLTAWKFQNNVALWKRGSEWHAWSLLCHHDYRLDPLTSWDYYSIRVAAVLGRIHVLLLIHLIARVIFLTKISFWVCLNSVKELLNIFQRVVKSAINGSQSSVFDVCTVGFSLSYILVRLI